MKNLQVFTSDVQSSEKIARGPEEYFCPGIEDLVKGQELEVGFSLSDCGNEILLQGEISGKIELECSLCLEDVWVPVNIKITASYPSTQEIIDVGEEIKQLLILNLPIKPLCKNECKGLCAVCGKNKNVDDCGCSQETPDPRWDKLKLILKKNDK